MEAVSPTETPSLIRQPTDEASASHFGTATENYFGSYQGVRANGGIVPDVTVVVNLGAWAYARFRKRGPIDIGVPLCQYE